MSVIIIVGAIVLLSYTTTTLVFAESGTATNDDGNNAATNTITIGPSKPTGDYVIVNVRTILDNGTKIDGIYTTVWQNEKSLQVDPKSKLYTPVSIQFINSSGQKYQIAVSDYLKYNFDHWSDGVTKRFHDITIGIGKSEATTITLTAVYYTSRPQ